MKKHSYWIICFILIIITAGTTTLTIVNVIPGILLLEVFFCMLILFIANLSSGITYAVICKNKMKYLAGFTLVNVFCIVFLIYCLIIGALII